MELAYGLLMALDIRYRSRIIALMKQVLAFLVALICIPAVWATEVIPPAVVEEWLKKNQNALLVDVRTPEEYAEGHIENAVLIDWQDECFEERVKAELDSAKPVLVICRSGRRSSEAAKAMKELGFSRIADLGGGMLAWRKAEMKIVTLEP